MLSYNWDDQKTILMVPNKATFFGILLLNGEIFVKGV